MATTTKKALEDQKAMRKARVDAGLTIYGTARKNYLWPELDGLDPQARMNARIRICTRRYRLIKSIPPQVEQFASLISELYPDLSGDAKSKCMKLLKVLTRLKHCCQKTE